MGGDVSMTDSGAIDDQSYQRLLLEKEKADLEQAMAMSIEISK